MWRVRSVERFGGDELPYPDSTSRRRAVVTIEGLAAGNTSQFRNAFLKSSLFNADLHTWVSIAAATLLEENNNPSNGEIESALAETYVDALGTTR